MESTRRVKTRLEEEFIDELDEIADERNMTRSELIRRRLKSSGLPNSTKIIFSRESIREDLVDELYNEIVKCFSVSEFVDLALRLLEHPDVEGPVGFLEKFGEYERYSGRDLWNSTSRQNWIQARDDYFGKAR